MPVISSGTATIGAFRALVNALEGDRELAGMRSGEVVVSRDHTKRVAMLTIMDMTSNSRERMSTENSISVPPLHQGRSYFEREIEDWYDRLVKVLVDRFNDEYISGTPGLTRENAQQGMFRNGMGFAPHRPLPNRLPQ